MPGFVIVETPIHRSQTPAKAGRSTRSADSRELPLLRPRNGGLAESVAHSFGGLSPAAAFAASLFLGFAVIALLSIGLGFLVTHVIEHVWGIGAADERVEVWFAAHRTPSRTEASLIGSTVAGGVVLPLLVGSIAVVCALLRKWRLAAFVVFALAAEAGTYRATTLLDPSHRPRVVRLEQLPVEASYPSGHTAASIAVYSGLALLLTSRFTNRVFRAFAWTTAVAITAFVATSRMYRGMHHPLDVAGGVFVGVAALLVIVFACRSAAAAAENNA
jgi:membrane-associated phospholipid phosphatase